MKSYETYIDLANDGPREVIAHIDKIISYDEDKIDKRKINFFDYFGGNVNIVEEDDDLLDIWTTKEAPEDDGLGWYSIKEVADAFDECLWIDDETYVSVFNATTDAGGASYFIPREIALRHDTVLKSIELTNEAWRGNN